jgi:hypothetical protein
LCLFNCPSTSSVSSRDQDPGPSNVNYRYGGDELRQLLDTAGAKVLLYDACDRVASPSAVDRLPLLIEVGNAPGN